MHVNTNTVLRALRLLRDEGLLELRPGQGIRVSGTPERSNLLAKASNSSRSAATAATTAPNSSQSSNSCHRSRRLHIAQGDSATGGAARDCISCERARGVSSKLRRMQISLSEAPFDYPPVQMLLTEWNDEIEAANPSFSTAGGSTVEPSDFAAPHGVFVLAVTDKTPIGCGGVRRLASTTGEVKRLFVCRAARGRGVGRALLDALEERAPQLGFTQLRLDTGGGEPGVLALFRSANYQAIPDYNANPYARYWFEKRL
jgi:GNAT superfamily N-acetyltransferase